MPPGIVYVILRNSFVMRKPVSGIFDQIGHKPATFWILKLREILPSMQNKKQWP